MKRRPTQEASLNPSNLEFQRLKTAIHEELVETLDLSVVEQVDERLLGAEIRRLAEEICHGLRKQLDEAGHRQMLDELMDEIFGVGPLEKLMKDPTVSDILVNGPHEVFVERRGRLERTDIVFADQQHLMRIIQRIVSRVGRRVDETSPMVDARLPDGSRVNAIIPPLALGGPKLSIRRFGAKPLSVEELEDNGTARGEMLDFLAAAVQARISCLISGGAGAGKTTLLDAMSAFIPESERLITIEDSAELILSHPHVIRMETREANVEGAGATTQRDLVRNSLRMRPDRIIIGEVRGPEALDMLQAMNTGHEGSLTTVHANDTRDALSRLEMMIAMAGFDLPIAVMRQYIAAGIRLVVHLARLKGGARRITKISEVVGFREGGYEIEDVFGFRQTGVDAQGDAIGEFYATGYRPRCMAQIEAAGIVLQENLFDAACVGV
ncbi:MAG: CpaF family protein [Patescibacteria group bacterium]|nr:CpaF family protein [Patescibacteria group bacterium]